MFPSENRYPPSPSQGHAFPEHALPAQYGPKQPPCANARPHGKEAERRTLMLAAAAQALSQMFSPPFRAVLLKSIGLALILIILVGVGLNHLLQVLATAGEGAAENAFGPGAHA